MIRIRSEYILLFFIVIFLHGCAIIPKPLVSEALTSDDVRIRLLNASPSPEYFSADGTITINTPTMTQPVSFELSTRGMDSVKMSVFGPFGITVGSAIFTKKEFAAYNALNNTVYRGSPEKQMRAFPFVGDIPFELFAGSLRGIHVFHDFHRIDSFAVHPGRFYTFSYRYENGSYDTFRYDDDVNRITRCTRTDAAGEGQWSVQYWYAHRDDGTVIPEQVEVSIPSKESSLQIEYSSFSIGIPAGDFRLIYPDDAVIITIE